MTHALDDSDLIDRLFDYLLQIKPALAEDAAQLAAMKMAVRDEFAGTMEYISARRPSKSSLLASQVLAQFNGRNATEVARCLGISRATVYRVLKQPGQPTG